MEPAEVQGLGRGGPLRSFLLCLQGPPTPLAPPLAAPRASPDAPVSPLPDARLTILLFCELPSRSTASGPPALPGPSRRPRFLGPRASPPRRRAGAGPESGGRGIRLRPPPCQPRAAASVRRWHPHQPIWPSPPTASGRARKRKWGTRGPPGLHFMVFSRIAHLSLNVLFSSHSISEFL